MSLFNHNPHPYQAQNANTLHQKEIAEGSLNTKIAVKVTKITGTMQCAYCFAMLALLGFPGLAAWFGPWVAIYVVWFSQTFLQLIFLPVITVGQNVLNRKQEIQSEEMYKTTEKSFIEIEQIAQHLTAQDVVLLEHSSMLLELLTATAQKAPRL